MRDFVRQVVSLLLLASIVLSAVRLNRLRYSRAEMLFAELESHIICDPPGGFDYYLRIYGLKEDRGISDVQDDLVALGEESVPVLVKALDHENWSVRSNVLITFWDMGPSAKSALPRLFDLAVNDPDEKTRGRALAAIVSIDRNSPQARELLEQAADSDKSRHVRKVASDALWSLDNNQSFAWQH